VIIGLYNIGVVILEWFICHKGMGCNIDSTVKWCWAEECSNFAQTMGYQKC
jgi:hypothetical protein